MFTRSCIKLVRAGRSATLLVIIGSLSGLAARALALVHSALAPESVPSISPPTVVPMVRAHTQSGAVRVGVEFAASTNGWLTAIESDRPAENKPSPLASLVAVPVSRVCSPLTAR